MSLAEVVAAAAVAAALVGGAFRLWTAEAERAAARAELEEAAEVAAEYRARNCDALPAVSTRLATLAAAVGRTLTAEDPAAWTVAYRPATAYLAWTAGDPEDRGRGSRRGGASIDLVLTTASPARRQAVADRGGFVSGTTATLTLPASGLREHRGRRSFAHLQGSAQC